MTSKLRAMNLSRRDFLVTAALGAAGVTGLPSIAGARDGFASLDHPILAHLFLSGGPDHRHLFPPAFSAQPGSYGLEWWRARARSQGVSTSTSALRAHWNDHYFVASDSRSGTEFGISQRAGWLRRMWEDGNVAIISNVVGDVSRNHENAIRSMELGRRDARFLTSGSGWGGRAAFAADGKVVSLTRSTRPFCLGPDPRAATDLGRSSDADVLPGTAMRNLLPYAPSPTASRRGDHVARSLRSYYAGKRGELPADSPYVQFLEHERKLREFGEAIDARLAGVRMPGELLTLGGDDAATYQGPVPRVLAQQMRDLHDTLACHDLLQARVISLAFDGWDTHDMQAAEIEPKLEALYGNGQGFARLWRYLPDSVRANLVLVVCGEFGRQLVDNGGGGTDHGRGNDMILIGEPVSGGLYGDKFPESELARLDERGADIIGLTAIDHLFGRLCDWLEPGSARAVFPGIDSAPLEPGARLASLLG